MSRRRRAWLSRLRCPCGQNLADVVTAPDGQHIKIQHRVEWTQYPPPFMGHPAPTYTWHCPSPNCGKEHRCRHERIVSAYLGAPAGRVDYLTLGVDL